MIKCWLDKKTGKVEPWAALQLAAYTLLDAPVEFIEEGHIYRVDGRRLPSVTGILKAKGFIDDTWYKKHDYNRELGKNVHLLTHLDDIDDLDESTIGIVEEPYFEAWRKFKRESGFVVEQSEISMMSSKHLYAGTFDSKGYFPSGNLTRAAIELHANGSYKLFPFTDRQDVGIFLNELPGFFWQQNNLKRKE